VDVCVVRQQGSGAAGNITRQPLGAAGSRRRRYPVLLCSAAPVNRCCSPSYLTQSTGRGVGTENRPAAREASKRLLGAGLCNSGVPVCDTMPPPKQVCGWPAHPSGRRTRPGPAHATNAPDTLAQVLALA
jgi:hypothetical protein